MAVSNALRPDAADLRHLDAWLDDNIAGDTRRSRVRVAMLALAETDPEYWWNAGYWKWVDSLPFTENSIALGLTDPDA